MKKERPRMTTRHPTDKTEEHDFSPHKPRPIIQTSPGKFAIDEGPHDPDAGAKVLAEIFSRDWDGLDDVRPPITAASPHRIIVPGSVGSKQDLRDLAARIVVALAER